MDTGVGRRIAYWREHRGLTQADFGRLMGQSRRWVQDLEGGQRQTDPRLSVLQRAADILRIPLERLVTDPAPTQTAPPGMPPDVAALADSLHTRHTLTPADRAPVPLPALRRRVMFCCQAWASCHYSAAARDLPAVLADAHTAAASGSAEAAALLSRAYQLTASLLFKYSEPARVPGAVAADRALAAAETSGDPVAIGAAARRVARGLIHQKRHTAAAQYATASASALREDLERGGPVGLSTLGMLYLVAAVGTTGTGRSPAAVAQATERLREAAEVAQRQGDDDADFTGFGPTNVALHEVDVLLRLDDAWAAVEAARRIEPAALAGMGRERRARHLVTDARASALTRRRDDATQRLLEAEQLAPEEVRRPSVARLVQDLLELVPSPGADLRGLAERCGVRP
ncbi:helix-turn-helix domain-containing protein [Streptomyces aidingensis]|uniref:Helix-turn-helix domain-containing protein n=1 Tax=Streptomyces aidingensis TaxID=910347 RepID=A0A1I1JEI1_9ACTN|nr:helix-turn-helix transcriptional regulator [Streptomyces aidingensis]SFC43840.1 Helix-turn-helix domain-containing protein [Streptomyces aidingensis]